jgi:hypothetical protein
MRVTPLSCCGRVLHFAPPSTTLHLLYPVCHRFATLRQNFFQIQQAFFLVLFAEYRTISAPELMFVPAAKKRRSLRRAVSVFLIMQFQQISANTITGFCWQGHENAHAPS